MASIMRSIGRLILRESSQSSSPARCLCTVRENPTRASQPKSRNTLFYKVVGANPKFSLVDVLKKWVDEGKPVKKADIINLSIYFRSRKNLQASLQLYEWMDSSNLEFTSSDQAVRLNLLGKVEGVASAEKYFDSIQNKTSNVYGALLSCYCKEKHLDKALEIFEKLKELNGNSTLNYNNLLSLYYNLEQPERVISLVQEMEKENITPDIYTYNMVINSHAALKNFDAFEEVLEKMESSNVKPDLFTYGNLATIYFNSGLHEKAATFLELMEKMGSQKGAASEREACYTRLKLHSMMGNLSGVNQAWEDLKSPDTKPSNTSYLFMLLALSKLGNQDNLEKIFNEWEEVRSLYDYRLPNVVLEYYLSRNMIEEANSLYERLKERESSNSSPNLKTLDLFAAICIKNSDIDLALEYVEMGLDKAKSRDSKWFPNPETVEAFISYFEENHDRERGGKFIESMKKHNRVIPDSFVAYIKGTETGS